MKTYFIIFILLLFSAGSFGLEAYINKPQNNIRYHHHKHRRTPPPPPPKITQTNTNLNKLGQIYKRLNKINQYNPGVLTGYSPSINLNTLKQMKWFSDNNNDGYYQTNTQDCNTYLYSNPQNNGIYYNNGDLGNCVKNITETTSATIIYD